MTRFTAHTPLFSKKGEGGGVVTIMSAALAPIPCWEVGVEGSISPLGEELDSSVRVPAWR